MVVFWHLMCFHKVLNKHCYSSRWKLVEITLSENKYLGYYFLLFFGSFSSFSNPPLSCALRDFSWSKVWDSFPYFRQVWHEWYENLQIGQISIICVLSLLCHFPQPDMMKSNYGMKFIVSFCAAQFSGTVPPWSGRLLVRGWAGLAEHNFFVAILWII